MTIEKDRVVSIAYELKGADGVTIDRSDGEPLVYLHGNDNIIPGLERELEGRKAGDRVQCVVKPADGYGERDAELVFAVPRKEFADMSRIEVGMQFQASQEDGVHVVTVVGIEGDEVKVDANHPLAGQTLHFDVTVQDVREATAEELEHGHVHGDHECGCECGEECGDECGEGCGDEACDDAGCGCGCH